MFQERLSGLKIYKYTVSGVDFASLFRLYARFMQEN